eukprot:Skav228988  [mRNA]  locus=scaffold127:93884:96749:+ [translate_table: standard]
MAFRQLVAIGLLPWASGLCQLRPGSEHVFECSYSGVRTPVDIRVKSWGPNRSFRLHLQLSQPLTKPDTHRNESACHELEVAAMVWYNANYLAYYEHGKLDQQGRCGIEDRSAILYCFEGENPTSHIEIGSHVESSDPAPVHVLAKLEQDRMREQRWQNFAMHVGGEYGKYAFRILEIPDDAGIDLWRLKLTRADSARGSAEDGAKNQIISVYLIPESSPCVSNVMTKGGCFDPEKIHMCIGSVPVSFLPDMLNSARVAMHMSFTTRGAMTLSKGSIPRLQPGRWIIFMICGDLMDPCPDTTVDVESYGETKLWLRLTYGFFAIVLGTLLVLVVVNALYWLAYCILYQCSPDSDPRASKQRLWPVMCGQCFYPGYSDAFPWNNVISNLAYFVAGGHVMGQAFCAETRCKKVAKYGMVALFQSMDPEDVGSLSRERWNEVFSKADGNRSGRVSRSEWREAFGTHYAFDFVDYDGSGSLERSEWDEAFGRFDKQKQEAITASDMVEVAMESRKIDLRGFYALGVALWGLGVGSMSYHVCPSLLTFQFDTCFMTPLANLFTLALLDWRASSSSETITSVKYIVYVLTPFWLLNFIGTWYDIKAFDITWAYWLYAISAVLWTTVVALASIRRIFQEPGCAGRWAKRILQCVVIGLTLLAFLVPQVRKDYFSGTANLFLQLSVIVMVVVVSRQIYLEDLRFVTCEAREIGARIIKNLYTLIFVGVGAVALIAFSEKVTIVEPGVLPAVSHDANQDCVFSIFDLHDVWHFLSAIALTLFAMLLLDVRVNAWARKMGIRILFEHEPPDMADSDGEEEEEEAHGNSEDEETA